MAADRVIAPETSQWATTRPVRTLPLPRGSSSGRISTAREELRALHARMTALSLSAPRSTGTTCPRARYARRHGRWPSRPSERLFTRLLGRQTRPSEPASDGRHSPSRHHYPFPRSFALQNSAPSTTRAPHNRAPLPITPKTRPKFLPSIPPNQATHHPQRPPCRSAPLPLRTAAHSCIR